MEHTSAFDLNASLRQWLDCLAQSPQFRPADLAELESHIRDSVNQLQSQGLSAEESFMVATKRVGAVEKLEPEFAKVHRSPKLIIIHLLILAFFSMGCWFQWALLKVAIMSHMFMARRPLPAFTVFMASNRSLLLIPPLLAAGYCLWALSRRNHSRMHWIGFFASTAGFLLLLAFPVIIALVLPLIDGIQQLSSR
jgi:hypothetical protein